MTTSRHSDASDSGTQPERLDALLRAARAGDGRASCRLGDLYRVAVRSVPLVVTPRSIGSSVVILVKPAESRAWVITNDHVVDEPFKVDGRRVAALVTYDREMKEADYSHARLLSCLGNKSEQGAWCVAARARQ